MTVIAEPTIQSDIPIPEKGAHGSGFTATLRRMNVGDSVVLAISANSVHAVPRAVLGKGNYTVRKVEGGYRVWRTA